jgi:hypothetical protein
MVVMGQQDEHPVDVINGWFTNHELVPGKHWNTQEDSA